MDFESKLMEFRGIFTIIQSFAGFYHVFGPNGIYIAGFEYLKDARHFCEYRSKGGTILPTYQHD